MNHLKLTPDRLSVEAISDLVVSSSCGAISLFVGTTRDNFEDKNVVHLEYEAHESMAIKILEGICNEMRTKWPDIENIAIYHRLGIVPVKEASIVIAVSSPHRVDAISATQWCIDNVKKTVPIWKKEVYSEDVPKWKENAESTVHPPRKRLFNPKITQEVKETYVPSHLIQIKASSEEIEQRIQKLMELKREEINLSNIRDFCRQSENSCARVDAVMKKRKDSKGHLQVNRVLNYYGRDQNNLDYLLKYIPKNGIDERLENVETQLSIEKPVSKNIYKRLKAIEDRLLHLESLSPEYTYFWDKNLLINRTSKKKTYTIDEIDGFIMDLEKKKTNYLVAAV